ncbi:uncharacterized protein LOC110093057 isoform X1 [Dendrobium catenatum]|uniref:uncharacterized protein LOC110093057 isoform X1 n=1 Tax=Dendrobium catenatum TaxID=906689 RepID=UPI0010A0BE06|nr:uncharacterized protein LOC110093057 isoform X1 [Dendrobium catenatum]
MEWWRRMLKKNTVSVADTEKPKQEGDGMLQLHDAIQTCEYNDILVMWEMLQNPHTELMQDAKPKSTDCKIVVASSHH